MRARLINADGTTRPADLPGGSDAADAIARATGCPAPAGLPVIGPSEGRPGLTFWHDPDGIFADQAENSVGTLLAIDLSGQTVCEWMTGTVVVTGALDSEGDIMPLTVLQDQAVTDLAGHWSRVAARTSEMTLA